MFNDWSSRNCLVDVSTGKGSDVAGQIPTIQCIFPLFQNIITAALVFGGIVALAFLIYGGTKLLRSQGDQKQVQGARQTITYAIVGLVLLFLSFFILNITAFVTGFDCIKEFKSFQDCK